MPRLSVFKAGDVFIRDMSWSDLEGPHRILVHTSGGDNVILRPHGDFMLVSATLLRGWVKSGYYVKAN